MRARTRIPLLAVCLPLGASVGAYPPAPSRAESNDIEALKPDCREAYACLCPWRDVLRSGDFQVLPASLVPTQVVRCWGQSECEWHVAEDERGIAIFHSRPDLRRDPLPVEHLVTLGNPSWDSRGVRHVVPVEGGWIVGFNSGEFGGGLWWVAQDGSRYRRLEGSNIVDLIKTPGGVIALTGLDHLSIRGKGEAFLVSRARHREWRAKRLAVVGASAYAATTAPDGSVLVVTRTQLVRLGLGGRVTVLHTGRWDDFFQIGKNSESAFYPGSVVARANGEIFVGMRAVLVRLVPQAHGYSEEWLAPAKCIERQKARSQ